MAANSGRHGTVKTSVNQGRALVNQGRALVSESQPRPFAARSSSRLGSGIPLEQQFRPNARDQGAGISCHEHPLHNEYADTLTAEQGERARDCEPAKQEIPHEPA